MLYQSCARIKNRPSSGIDKQSCCKCPLIPSSAEDTQHNIKDYIGQSYHAYQHSYCGSLPLANTEVKAAAPNPITKVVPVPKYSKSNVLITDSIAIRKTSWRYV